MKILFYPYRPSSKNKINDICVVGKHEIITNINIKCDLAFHWNYNDKFRASEELRLISNYVNVQNLDYWNSRKCHVDNMFKKAFGYSSFVDIEEFEGKCVEKSNNQATHDGKIIESPVLFPRKDYIYQKFIETKVNYKETLDLRIVVYFGKLSFLLLKYKDIKNPFKKFLRFEVAKIEDYFSDEEIKKTNTFIKLMNLDYGEIDILRDNNDLKMYIIDVNPTPGNMMYHNRDDRVKYAKLFNREFKKSYKDV